MKNSYWPTRFITVAWLAVPTILAAADTTRVLPDRLENGVPPVAMLETHLKKLAYAALDRRDLAFEQRTAPEELRAWQQRTREFFRRSLGPFPTRTPLQARVTGRAEFADHRIEKVIFESQPGFFVTGTLYLPLAPGPHPGVLHPTGHSANAKAAELYQRANIVLAKSGCVVLCYDPVGQGERRHFLDASGQPVFGSTTSEHQIMGLGCTLLGTSIARYMIWDGMRGIDYLQSRAEVDPKRIGCTGISGGGTMTSYLMALDERIGAAAPGCYLTGYRRLLETIGPQDFEQNNFGQIAFGLDHGDYVMLRAPQPTLIMAATQDYFDITGAWNLFRQSKRFYTRLGFAERVELIEPDTRHGFPTEMRVGAARWMRRWLMDRNDAVTEGDFPVLKDEQLQCTARGQVLLEPGARSLFDLNRDWERRLATERAAFWKNSARPAALSAVREAAGIRPLAEIPMLVATSAGATERAGVRVEKIVFTSEPGIWLPARLFTPVDGAPAQEPILHLSGTGMLAGSGPGGELEQLARAGHRVLAMDLRGLGEMARPAGKTGLDAVAGGDWKESTLAYLLGRSLVGMRAEDVLAAARHLAGANAGGAARIRIVASGEAGVPALHAVALEQNLFSNLVLRGTPPSWAGFIQDEKSRLTQAATIFGALRHYDLPDLVASLPAGMVTRTE